LDDAEPFNQASQLARAAALVSCQKEFIARKYQIVSTKLMLRRLRETNTLELVEEPFPKG